MRVFSDRVCTALDNAEMKPAPCTGDHQQLQRQTGQYIEQNKTPRETVSVKTFKAEKPQAQITAACPGWWALFLR
jgi:hypothetical protein